MLFNTAKNYDFQPTINLDNECLETVEETKLLGVILRSDLRWGSNTDSITSKAYKRLWILRRLSEFGANRQDLLDVYILQIRPVMEFAVPVWHPGITVSEAEDIERVQKSAIKLILKRNYSSYSNSLKALKLDTLTSRRQKMCNTFSLKAVSDIKFKSWFKLKVKSNSRVQPQKYWQAFTRMERLKNSPINFLTGLLNNVHLT